MSKVRKGETADLRRKLDSVISKAIRSTSRTCFTCGGYGDQAGHYIRRGVDATRFDEDNIRLQCFSCNVEKFGNLEVFRKRLIEEIGLFRVKEVERKSRLTVKFSNEELQNLIQQY